ncbi:MAG: DUF4292 domain-containing protein [Bacteroidetes bacterium]|nr:MAG: DUF4292 domain-containing protein [Bacteroidota bacterium]
MNKIFLGLIILAILSACHKKKIIKTVTAPEYKQESNKRKTRKLIRAKDADFSYLNCKSKIEFSDGVDNFNANANIRVRKDSIIWISITATLGIEALRCLITKDSVYIINKLQKEYYCYSYQSLKKRFNFNFDYNFLQSVIFGNAPYVVLEQDSSYDCLDTTFTNTRQIRNEIKVENYIKNSTLKLHKLDIYNVMTNDNISIIYDNFQRLDLDTFFGFINKISLNYQNRNGFQSFYLGLEHQKVETGMLDLKFPFNVKQKFERKE